MLTNTSFRILLISTYELGRQPFGIASPAAWLRQAGFPVSVVDCAVQPFPEAQIRDASLIAFYTPMHTATRLAVAMLPRVRSLNPDAAICFYGLYAPLNADLLRDRGVDIIIGGEFETQLVQWCTRLARGERPYPPAGEQVPPEPLIFLPRQQFLTPDRSGLPPLSSYAQLCCGNAPPRVTGYTETTRGCKYHCRHCPIVPVYNGTFRVIQREVVLSDIRQQVAAGARHITFGDPDFFNGPGHVLPVVEALHWEFPDVTYDVTIKIEHLLKFARLLPVLRDTGCAFVTSAVESVDDRVLKIFDKGHTRADFLRVVALFEELGMVLNPTFVAFHPWLTLADYRDLLETIARLNLIDKVSPIQLAIRLLIPRGSKLLELPEVRALVGPFPERDSMSNPELLTYEWSHPDPRVDELHCEVMEIVTRMTGHSRAAVFARLWQGVNERTGDRRPLPRLADAPGRCEVPYLNEPWYC